MSGKGLQTILSGEIMLVTSSVHVGEVWRGACGCVRGVEGVKSDDDDAATARSHDRLAVSLVENLRVESIAVMCTGKKAESRL